MDNTGGNIKINSNIEVVSKYKRPFHSDNKLKELIHPSTDFKRIFKGDKLTDEAL